jgi:hypothetical protein
MKRNGDLEDTNREASLCQKTGRRFVCLCGQSDYVEVKKNIAEINWALDYIIAVYSKNEENHCDVVNNYGISW